MFHVHMRYILLYEIYNLVGKNLEWVVLEDVQIKDYLSKLNLEKNQGQWLHGCQWLVVNL